MKLLISLLLLTAVTLFAADKRVFTDAGPCPKCGAVLHDISPVKVQPGSTHIDANGTATTEIAWFRCKADKTVFPLTLPPRHLPPPITTEKITPKSEKKVALGRVTPLPPPTPIVWEQSVIRITNRLSMAQATNLLYPHTWKMKLP